MDNQSDDLNTHSNVNRHHHHVFNQYNLNYIPPEEFRTGDSIGRGSFGEVKKGYWNGIMVAIKHITKDEFEKEAEKLSRVKHENIIGFYGYTEFIDKNRFGLFLEYADCGNLYNLLHECQLKSVHYTLSHAISWCLQCARGVHYLHSLNIIHRDLKPPNLLLTRKCRTIKICDFGTARDKQTSMSVNKGTPFWMAPEVFKSKNYTEKCDVFSWAIILWEVLTRRVPYNTENTWGVMWSICVRGLRPPMIRDCPQILRILLTSCWHRDAMERPSMDKVVCIMEKIFSLCPDGAEQEIELIRTDNFDNLRISNIPTNSFVGGNNLTNSMYFNDDFLRMPKSNLGHRRSNSTDASIILESDAYNGMNEERIQDILRQCKAYLLLPQQFYPVQPVIANTQSMLLFEEYCNQTLKLFAKKIEYEILKNRLQELEMDKMKNRVLDENESMEYFMHLTNEKREMKQMRALFAKQLLDLSTKFDQTEHLQADGEWIMVESSPDRQG